LLVEAAGFELLSDADEELSATELCRYLPRSSGEMQHETYSAGCFIARNRSLIVPN